MPNLRFDIDTYTVQTTYTGTVAQGTTWRVLTLTSTALAHGIRNRASIYFFESAISSPGVVTNVDQPNFNGLTAYAYARMADFAAWYDILRNEAPLTFSCEYAGPAFDPATPSRTISWFQLFTGQQEPPGEGPDGASTALRLQALEQAGRPAAA